MSEEEKRRPIKLIDDPSEVPTDLSDEEELRFWETHGLSEEFLDKTEELSAAERPHRREKATPISVRFDASTLDRLKALAEQKGVGYQTLLKQFVGERLYEEEKREGLFSALEDPEPVEQAAGQGQDAVGGVADQAGQVTDQAEPAARRFAKTLADSYRVVYGQAVESEERQQQRAQEFSELVRGSLREQAEAGRSNTEQLSDQAARQQDAGQEFARESVEAYTQFLDDAFSRYMVGTEAAPDRAGKKAGEAAEVVESATVKAGFPIPSYDEMNVQEVSERLDDLSTEELQLLRDYEARHNKRLTLLERMDRKIRVA